MQQIEERAIQLLPELWKQFESENLTSLEGKLLRRENALRYLVASKLNVDDAVKRIRFTWQWRKDNNVDFLSIVPLMNHMRTGKNYQMGFDKQNRPIIIMRCALDTPDDVEGKFKFMLYQLERVSRTINKEYDKNGGTGLPPKICWLIDCAGFGAYLMSPEYSKMVYNLATALNNHYPERLGVIWIVNAPWIFSTFWRLCSAFVDPETYKKLIMVPNSDPNFLLQFVDAHQLEIPFGGTNSFKFSDEYIQAVTKEEEEWLAENKELSQGKFDMQSVKQ